jgi:site-specific DNA recombinase
MIRVAAYCRVSTDQEDQANSFASQKRYFREYIERNPDWELYKVFADEGFSGTSTKKRKDFNRMIAAAKNGCFNLMITKEVSRFARNTLDTLQYTRELKHLGIGVLFMNDNINTLDPDAELRLTIMSSIAQEESRKTSERVKWGQKRRMEQGVVFGRDMLGYDVHDGKLYINEAGAKVVRLIYHKFIEESKGTHVIARELREAGIETATRMKEWTATVILRVLRNEKYCGDLIQKKTYTPDYLSHDKKYNRGEEDFVVLRDHHEPIISRELFERAQKELELRSPSENQKRKHSNRYCLSGKIECGCCGSRFVSRTKKRQDGSRYKAWRCYEAAQHGLPHIDKAGNSVGCSVNQQIRDEDFMLIVQQVIRHLRVNKKRLIDDLIDIVKTVLAAGESCDIDSEKLKRKIELIAEKKDRLVDLYLNKEISKDEYRRMTERYDSEKTELEAKIQDAQKQQNLADTQEEMISDIATTIMALTLGEKQDDIFYRNIVDKIVVHSRQSIDVYLKLLPFKWAYALAELPGNPGKKNETLKEHFITDVPMSVSMPLTSA